MNITNAKYYSDEHGNDVSITCEIDGISYSVPLVEGNVEYDEILRQVESGDLTIADADPIE